MENRRPPLDILAVRMPFFPTLLALLRWMVGALPTALLLWVLFGMLAAFFGGLLVSRDML